MSTQITIIIVVLILCLTCLLSQVLEFYSNLNFKKQSKQKVLEEVLVLERRIKNEAPTITLEDISKELRSIFYRN